MRWRFPIILSKARHLIFIPITKANIVTAGLRPNLVLNNQTLFLPTPAILRLTQLVYNPKTDTGMVAVDQTVSDESPANTKIEAAEKMLLLPVMPIPMQNATLLDAGTRYWMHG